MEIKFWKENRTIEKLFVVGEMNKPSAEFVPLGIREFDKVMDGGMRGGELIVISGQTGMGKTLWAQTITCNINKIDIPNLWFTYEMSPYYLKGKFVQMGQTLKDPIFSPIVLANGTINFIKGEIQEAIDEEGCKVVFIDHLHYLIPLEQSINASLLIGGVVRELKKIAIQFNIIIVLIAHTKKVYQGEELDLSSVRDSSLICQESDYVFLVERIKVEPPKNKKLDIIISSPVGTEWTNNTRIKLAKNRRTGKMIFVEFQYNNGVLIPITNFYGDKYTE